MSLSSRASSDRLRVIVLGYIVRMPLGGLVWHYLQYVMGLKQLGHEVYYVEDSCLFEDDEQSWSYNPTTNTMESEATYGLRFAADTFQSVGLAGHWVYYDAQADRWHGPCADRIRAICSSADLLLNVSGANPLRPWLMEIPTRVFIDTDPTFTQIRHLTNTTRRELALQHNKFLSFGENIGSGRSTSPDDGFPWQATRQPIVLDAWPVTPAPPDGGFTTVMAWKSYKQVEEYGGVQYGLKAASFEPYMSLPSRNGVGFELALFGSPAPRERLREHGWHIRDAGEPTRDAWTYQQYIQNSKAEFSVAKHGYVVSRCGWFSERSAAYLASGRPVLVQETGFSNILQTGLGIITFNTLDEALSGIAEINGDYENHCGAARSLAEEYFDAGKVLTHLIELTQ